MIEYNLLKKLLLETLKLHPETTIPNIINYTWDLARNKRQIPTAQEYINAGYTYSEHSFNPIDELKVNQIVWDLIIDRVLTVGRNTSNWELPSIRLTDYGKMVIDDNAPNFYDPDGYLLRLKSIVPNIDIVIIQYLYEGLNCYKQRLYFASAVMVGAASEKLILLLIQSIKNYEKDIQKIQKIDKLINNPNLPKIFEIIEKKIKDLTDNDILPYNVHSGSVQHLTSLFEAIRVQRNESVHPQISNVSKEKIIIFIQSFPFAIEVIYRLINWFNNNRLS